MADPVKSKLQPLEALGITVHQPEHPFSLEAINEEIGRLEDSIILALVERAQYPQNRPIYTSPDDTPKEFSSGSMLDRLLHDVECAHGPHNNATVPERGQVLAPNTVNVNEQLMHVYLHHILPSICVPGDDACYGSCTTKDVEVLQRKFTAEAKYRRPDETNMLHRAIKAKDRGSLEDLLSDHAADQRLLRRLRWKALLHGRDVDHGVPSPHYVAALPSPPSDAARSPITIANHVTDVYERYVIPLTRYVEVEYLMQRGEYQRNEEGHTRQQQWQSI
ncbi:chorismate mutase aro7 [Geranomyces michiganensis]|nr:chorismate mutase aro7 [Geranomyces michiganensis]